MTGPAFGYWPHPRKQRWEVKFPTGVVLVGYGDTLREASVDAFSRAATNHPTVRIVQGLGRVTRLAEAPAALSRKEKKDSLSCSVPSGEARETG